MDKKLSVIVTIYNTPVEYLKKCIDSIINQTLKEIEIILVNDGSKKEIENICEKYKKQDNRIKLINQKNMGESVARNVGIENSTTVNITFVDSDDYIETQMCEKIYTYIEEIKFNYDIIIFNCYVNYSSKTVKNRFYPKSGILDEKDIEQIQLQNIERGIVKYYPPETNISVPWAKIYNKKFIQNNQIKYIPNLIRMTDAVFNMEAFEKAKKIYVYQEYLYHYNKNEFAICQKYSKDTILYYEKYIELLQKYIQKYNKNEKFKDTANLKIVTNIDKYMYNYYFHSDNPERFNKIKGELKELLKKEIYQKAMNDVKKEHLSKYQRLILYNAKKGQIKNLKILKNIKKILKNIQGKN